MPRFATFLVLLVAISLAFTAMSAGVAGAATASSADPLSELGARSPSCREDVGPAARRNCEVTGSIAHRYPVSAYGLDNQIGLSISNLGDSYLGALQTVAGLLWMGLVFIVKGVLLLLEWAFSIDLLGESMSGVRQTLATLHNRVIGEPWFLAALSVTALWGIWRGLVQRQATQTILGLATTLLLLVAGLVVLARPDDTVGRASRMVNEASLGILSAATSQDIDHPTRSLADATIGVFDAMVRDPWCALQFGSVTYCAKHPPGHPALTNADVWLRYPANSPERKALYKLVKGQDPEDDGKDFVDSITDPIGDAVGLGGDDEKPAHLPEEVKAMVVEEPARAQMQEADGTFTRLALLALIAIGMTGAAALLAYLGVRLLLAAVMSLLLLLLLPAMLLAPCFGESGRATFIAWAKRLLGALAAKLIYALFLAVVLAGAATLRQLDIGWFGTWLLQIAFWWGVLLKRNELIGFVSVRPQSAEGHRGIGSTLAQGYYVMQMGRVASRGAKRLASRPARAGAAVRARHEGRVQARSAATAHLAGEELDASGRQVLEAQHHDARQTLGQRREAERELRAIDRSLTGFDESHARARASNMPAPQPTDDQRALLDRRRELRELASAPDALAAGQIVAHGDRNRAQTGAPVSPQDLTAYRRQRAADHAANLPVDHERNLRAAGIDPAQYRRASDTEQQQFREDVQRHLARERDLLGVLPDMSPRDENGAAGRARVHIDPMAYRARVADERARARRDRRAQRARPRPTRR